MIGVPASIDKNMKSAPYILALIIGILTLIANAEVPAPKVIKIDETYGTLAFKGWVERYDEGDNIRFVVKKLKLTFKPSGDVNRTLKIDAKHLLLIATVKPETGKGPWKRIYMKKSSIDKSLTTTSPHTEIINVEFTIPKSTMKQADRLGLGVTDGSLLWPVLRKGIK